VNLSHSLKSNNRKSPPIICFSHLRWDFVLQRPQHLMSRMANDRAVFFFEEHIETEHTQAYLEFHPCKYSNVVAVRPRIPASLDEAQREQALSQLLDQLLLIHRAGRPVLWFYTPMMFRFARHVDASAVVYDCMDELSNFRFAPDGIRQREEELLRRADVVFTGGYSIYEAKRHQHDNIHPFPSSVDRQHFAKAREAGKNPPGRDGARGPVFGYYGVIDERIDLELLREVARRRPDWKIVMVGPFAKIDEAELPREPNIEFAGMKDYHELPKFLGSWDVALMPFAINDSTRFISPTKTPEYLAGGRPVVSTPVRDVVRHYGEVKGVFIAEDAERFIDACEQALELSRDPESFLPQVDEMLSKLSWDKTCASMNTLLEEAIATNNARHLRSFPKPWARRGDRATHYDFIIAGAGFSGSVLAERLASAGKKVFLCDKRPHVAGNAFDFYNEDGILIHKYGPHIFHTNSEEIFNYLSRFTRWRPYEHRVLASTASQLLPIPINRTTLNALYGLDLQNEEEAAAFLAARAEPVEDIRTSRDVVISQVGTDLYRTFFEGYTRKQWGVDPSELDKSVTARVPARASLDDRYFLDRFQAMPRDGYTRMFERMVDHPGIDLALGTDFHDLGAKDLAPLTIYTGPIDRYFGHRFGHLPYRSLEFRHETHDRRRFQEVATVNYPDAATPWTRITEYKHLTGQSHPQTSITYEFARAEGDPFYPVPRAENRALYRQYEALARTIPGLHFVGRLGTYQYYNMDQVVAQALATFRRLEAGDGAQVAAGA
jgi:UDP-galactopyranose mutase